MIFPSIERGRLGHSVGICHSPSAMKAGYSETRFDQ